MAKVVIDIETIGFDFDAYDQKSQEYLLKYAQDDGEKEEIKKKLSLYPLTGEIVTIGMLNPETEKGYVLFQNGGENQKKFEEDGVIFEAGSEKEILEKFWDFIRTYNQAITFNGRGFDMPYLMMRSAINKIKPSRNFMGYRFDHKEHCDLLEQLTFYGATRKFNLDFYAKTFGIKSSKDEGIDGSMVSDLYKQGKYLEIARYCARDLKTTKELFEYWEKYLKF
ncbi:MAG TPA: ribonuclease H-like domain-containing protein [Candidatus Moranbacteria bacterium]|nr:ribonuclease H-like domain-containing protein [Candidatus Moranbacteria bacterium]